MDFQTLQQKFNDLLPTLNNKTHFTTPEEAEIVFLHQAIMSVKNNAKNLNNSFIESEAFINALKQEYNNFANNDTKFHPTKIHETLNIEDIKFLGMEIGATFANKIHDSKLLQNQSEIKWEAERISSSDVESVNKSKMENIAKLAENTMLEYSGEKIQESFKDALVNVKINFLKHQENIKNGTPTAVDKTILEQASKQSKSNMYKAFSKTLKDQFTNNTNLPGKTVNEVYIYNLAQDITEIVYSPFTHENFAHLKNIPPKEKKFSEKVLLNKDAEIIDNIKLDPKTFDEILKSKSVDQKNNTNKGNSPSL